MALLNVSHIIKVTFIGFRFTRPSTGFKHHSPFRTFLTIASICLPYSLIFRQSRALVQGKQTTLRSTVMSVNRKNQEGFLEISSVFSGSARYFNAEYLTFFQNQKGLFIRCQLYKDAAEKHTDNTSTFHPFR